MGIGWLEPTASVTGLKVQVKGFCVEVVNGLGREVTTSRVILCCCGTVSVVVVVLTTPPVVAVVVALARARLWLVSRPGILIPEAVA